MRPAGIPLRTDRIVQESGCRPFAGTPPCGLQDGTTPSNKNACAAEFAAQAMTIQAEPIASAPPVSVRLRAALPELISATWQRRRKRRTRRRPLCSRTPNCWST